MNTIGLYYEHRLSLRPMLRLGTMKNSVCNVRNELEKLRRPADLASIDSGAEKEVEIQILIEAIAESAKIVVGMGMMLLTRGGRILGDMQAP
jgi:hypothetical protein